MEPFVNVGEDLPLVTFETLELLTTSIVCFLEDDGVGKKTCKKKQTNALIMYFKKYLLKHEVFIFNSTVKEICY